MAELKGFEGAREGSAKALLERTGQDVDAWNRRVRAEAPEDEAGVRAWLQARGVTGYVANLLVRERFGYPEWMTATAEALIEEQYADRRELRPIFDAIIEAASELPDVVVQARKTYVSLVGPKRTFARLQAATRTRVDLALRLDPRLSRGRLEPSRIHEDTPVQISFSGPEEVDADALRWLRRAWEENR